MPSIGTRDGRVDENKTNWLHSFFFFAPIFLNTESITEEKQEEIPFLRGQLCTHFQKHLPRVLLKSSTVGMAENQTRGRGRFADIPGAGSPASAPCQDTRRENPDSDLEKLRVCFRTFSSSDESDPIKALRRLHELCSLWLRPDLHTKEEMVDRLVLEQFVMCMPPDIQVLVKSSGAQTCKDLEEVLRKKQKLTKWVSRTLVTL